jgi:hypothetical protein
VVVLNHVVLNFTLLFAEDKIVVFFMSNWMLYTELCYENIYHKYRSIVLAGKCLVRTNMFADNKRFEYIRNVRLVCASVSYKTDINYDINTRYKRRTHNAYFIVHRLINLQFAYYN